MLNQDFRPSLTRLFNFSEILVLLWSHKVLQCLRRLPEVLVRLVFKFLKESNLLRSMSKRRAMNWVVSSKAKWIVMWKLSNLELPNSTRPVLIWTNVSMKGSVRQFLSQPTFLILQTNTVIISLPTLSTPSHTLFVGSTLLFCAPLNLPKELFIVMILQQNPCLLVMFVNFQFSLVPVLSVLNALVIIFVRLVLQKILLPMTKLISF
mmetsp:Transcript_5835/g.7643  ORF Transcript_5835/g.7643 Transcript_5835/m.7643 type:complete len:207 (-) Transcript_5835:437-1057(-)